MARGVDMNYLLRLALGIKTPLFHDDFDAEKWLEKYGKDPTAALNALNTLRLNEAEGYKAENAKTRAARREEADKAEKFAERVKELESKQLAEGSVTLTPEEAKTYQSLLNGKSLTDFKAAYEAGLSEVEGAKQAKASLLIREAADLQGYKATVLEPLIKDKRLEIVEKDGVKSVVLHVDDKTQMPLSEYATKHLADFLPALEAKTEIKKADGSKQSGTVPSGSLTDEQVAKEFVKNRYAVPNKT